MIAYCARDLTSGRELASNADAVMPSWSTIKLLLAAAFWRAVEAGELGETQVYALQPWQAVGGSGVLHGFPHAAKLTLADLVHLSLAVSDNDATNIVLSFVGFERVNALADELGLILRSGGCRGLPKIAWRRRPCQRERIQRDRGPLPSRVAGPCVGRRPGLGHQPGPA